MKGKTSDVFFKRIFNGGIKLIFYQNDSNLIVNVIRIFDVIKRLYKIRLH